MNVLKDKLRISLYARESDDTEKIKEKLFDIQFEFLANISQLQKDIYYGEFKNEVKTNDK